MNRILALAAVALFTAPVLASSGDAEVGRKKSEPCKACHGEGGISATPEFPNLAGQHQDYLSTALNHYKSGKRKNPIIQAQVANLTAKDMMDLAAYFSHQQGLAVKH